MEYMILMGAEDVSRAGSRIKEAASNFGNAISNLESIYYRHQQFLDECIFRLEQALKDYSTKRRVIVYEDSEKKLEKYHGIFHGFGMSYDEFETGPGMFSTAIVEKDDGSITNPWVELVSFIHEEIK